MLHEEEWLTMWPKTTIVFPHEACCPSCFEARICNRCGKSTRNDAGRCTNGCCAACHASACGKDDRHTPPVTTS